VPWCEQCAKFWNPSSMTAEGACPTCGRRLERPTAPADPPAAERVTDKNLDLRELAGDDAKAPWHFKVLMVLVVLYLAWRIINLVVPGVG
jgi:hypothetical protein